MGHTKDVNARRRLNTSIMENAGNSPSGSDEAAAAVITGADNRCHSDRWDRSVCPYVVPCEPAEACVGDNVCANGYTGMKCSKCMEGFSRQDGYCVECAGNPIIMILFVALGAVIAGVVYWIVVVLLKINIGVISIGIDYFQVIGLFSSQQIPWPNVMRTLFSYLQVFSFDLGMLGLECGGLKPHEMWFLIMLVPLGVLLILISGVLINILKLYLCKARKLANDLRKDLADGKFDGNEHIDSGLKDVMELVEKRIGLCMTLFLTVFYLMYVQITEEEKAILARVEARVDIRRKKAHAARIAKKASSGIFGGVSALEITGVRKYRRQKNKAKWTAFKKKAHFHKDLFKLNNSNASSEEKKAASVIEACMKGRLERQKLHDRITNSGTEEEKAILARVEARVDIRRK